MQLLQLLQVDARFGYYLRLCSLFLLQVPTTVSRRVGGEEEARASGDMPDWKVSRALLVRLICRVMTEAVERN